MKKTMKNSKKTFLKSSLKIKMTAGIIFIAILVFGFSSWLFYNTLQNQFRENTKTRLMDKVSIAALQIDSQKHSELKNPEQEGSDKYNEIKKTLQNIRDVSSDIYYIYTMREDETGNIIFIVDAEENPEEISHLGEEYFDASSFLKKNFKNLTITTVEDDFYTDRWGTWLTGYAPFYHENGEREGVLGIDIKANKIKEQKRVFLVFSFLLFVFLGVTTVLLSLFFSNKLIRPIISLTKGMEKFKQGEDFYIEPKGSDEIAILTQELNELTREIKDSQKNLEERVEERVKELEKSMNLMVGRELKMTELKKKIKELEAKNKKL